MRLVVVILLLLGCSLAVNIKVSDTQPTKTIVVAADGSGDYKTVMEAFNAIPNGNNAWIEILVKPGRYNAHVIVPSSKTFVKLIGGGSSPSATVLSFDITTSTPNVSYEQSGAFVAENNDFYAQGLTFLNTHGAGTQAIALSVSGERQQFSNCIIEGYQDTLYAASGLQYFENCMVRGAVDFIYGGANALLDSCTIHNVGYGAVTAARTPQGNTYGLTFLNCNLTAESNVSAGSTYLGRTWGPYATVDFLYCYEGAHISPLGWNNMGYPQYQPTVRLGEYKDTGPGSATAKRVDWSSQLTSAEAAKYTKSQILGSWTPM